MKPAVTESITKKIKWKIALEQRPAHKFYDLLRALEKVQSQIKEIEVGVESNLAAKENDVMQRIMFSLSSMVSIMENHPLEVDDIRDVEIIRVNNKFDMEIQFKRYRQCKLQPIHIVFSEFKKNVVEIAPTIPSLPL